MTVTELFQALKLARAQAILSPGDASLPGESAQLVSQIPNGASFRLTITELEDWAERVIARANGKEDPNAS